MAYFRNNTVNLLNLHYGLHSFALSGSSAFFGVFLLKSGVPAPIVLASIAAILLGRFLIRPGVLVFARRFGLKPLLIVGTIATGLQYPLLADVQGVGAALFVLCAVLRSATRSIGRPTTPTSPPWAIPSIADIRSGSVKRPRRW